MNRYLFLPFTLIKKLLKLLLAGAILYLECCYLPGKSMSGSYGMKDTNFITSYLCCNVYHEYARTTNTIYTSIHHIHQPITAHHDRLPSQPKDIVYMRPLFCNFGQDLTENHTDTLNLKKQDSYLTASLLIIYRLSFSL